MSDLGELKSKLTFFVTGYTFAVGVLYEWGYWGRFNVNILQFMTLTDVARSFAYPFVTAIFFFVIGAVLASGDSKVFPEGGGRYTQVGIVLNRWIGPLLMVYFAFAMAAWWLGGLMRWMIPAGMLVPVLGAMVSRYELLHGVISDPSLRRFISFVGVGMPVLAFAYGATQAEEVLAGFLFDQAKLPNDETTYKYLGHAGEYVFLLTADNRTVHLRKASDTLPLQLTRTSKLTGK